MADLHWFPFFAKDWLSSPARSAMTPEQRGAYIDLLAYAWGNGDDPPALPDDDTQLAALSGLGKRWAKFGGVVRAQFVAANGLLVNEKLSDVWMEQQTRHGKAVLRGKKAGEASALRRKRKSTTSSNDVDQSESEEAVEASPLGLALPASAPVGALAPEAPRAPAPTGRFQPYSPAQEQQADPDADYRAAYRARLLERVNEWCGQNPEDAAALEEAAKVELTPPLHRLNPTDAMRRVIRERVILEVSKRNPKWPTEDQFIAKQRLAKMEESAA